MAPPTTLDVLTALATQQFDAIRGAREGDDIDFKLAPYPLHTDAGKWELAKDVAAFANRGGGYIVIGVKARKLPAELAELADEIRPVARAAVNGQQLRAVISDWIFPAVAGVDLKWYPDDGADGLLLVHVPPQRTSKHFLVRRTVDGDGKRFDAVAVPIRSGDQIEWLRPEQIHHALQLAALVQTGTLVAQPVPQLDRADLDARAATIRRHVDATDDATIILQAVPSSPLTLLTEFFVERGLAGQIARWHGIRRMGFDLETLETPVGDGESLLFGGGRWRARLHADGVFELALPVRDDFLGWNMRGDQHAHLPPRINALPLVEVVHDFMRFVSIVLMPRTSAFWKLRLRALDCKSREVEFYPGYAPRVGLLRITRATSDDFAQELELEGNAGGDAFAALSRLYALWQLGSDAIPFTRDGRVDADAITKT